MKKISWLIFVALTGCNGTETPASFVGEWINVQCDKCILEIKRNGEGFIVRETVPDHVVFNQMVHPRPTIYNAALEDRYTDFTQRTVKKYLVPTKTEGYPNLKMLPIFLMDNNHNLVAQTSEQQTYKQTNKEAQGTDEDFKILPPFEYKEDRHHKGLGF